MLDFVCHIERSEESKDPSAHSASATAPALLYLVRPCTRQDDNESEDMKLKKGSLLFTTLILVTSFVFPSSAIANGGNDPQGAEEAINILQSWSGDYPVAQLDLLPEALRDSPVGYIDDANTFGRIWQAFKPEEAIPAVDFKVNLVLFVRNTQFYNRINIGKVKLEKGVGEIVAMETLSAIPIEDRVAMSLVVVSRKGITGIKSGNTVISLPDM